MIEAISSTQLDEERVLHDSKMDLRLLKNEVVSDTIEQKKADFSLYLKKNGINSKIFPRSSWKWKFLRTFRYYSEIAQSIKHTDIPMDYFFALKMIEWEWDPTNINVTDGWAGISQIQPDTFTWFSKKYLNKKWKIFSDLPQYKAYDYTVLMKKYNNRDKVNNIIAHKLLKIKSDSNENFGKLAKIDDRFNPKIALEFSAQYILYCKQQVTTKELTDSYRDIYKNDKTFDFGWLLAFNGYNKWPKNFSEKFDGSHISNLKVRIQQYREYSKQLEIYLKQWLNNQQIVQNFKDNEPKKIVHTPIQTTQQLSYLNKSKDKQRNVYKFILPSSGSFSTTDQFIQLTTFLSTKFAHKTITLSDEYWNPLRSYKKWDIIYIKEKID